MPVPTARSSKSPAGAWRRKFFEAKETDGRRAAEMLTLVRELYAVEDAAKTLDDDQRREIRQAQRRRSSRGSRRGSTPSNRQCCLDSAMGQAIGYALNQWDALCVYATEGFLAIDNNAAERAMKRVAIGRKNWLFAGNDRAGETTALLYTLIASAQRHGVDPQRYLTRSSQNCPSRRRRNWTSSCPTCGRRTTWRIRRRNDLLLCRWLIRKRPAEYVLGGVVA